MKIVFATCEEIPQGTADDELFKKALIEMGHKVETHIWTDASVNWQKFDVCLPRSTWDYHKKRDLFLSWAEKISRHSKLINPLEVLRWNSSKDYLLELQQQGLPVVPTEIYSSFDEGLKAAQKSLKKFGLIVLKPVISATSDLTYFISKSEDLNDAIATILRRGKMIIQPLLSSVTSDGELSLIYFKIDGRLIYSHSVRKLPKAGDYRVQGEFGGSSEPIEATAAALEAAEKTVSLLPAGVCYARVDFLDWKTNPQIGEIELVEPELFFRHIKNSRHSFRSLSQWID